MIPERLGHYAIVRPLGEGGMGEVYLATDTKLRRQVALKVLPAAFSSDPERLARLQREARTLASLTHPNIAAIYGFEDAGDIHAIVMELADGATLADLTASGPIAVDEALKIARQLADALEYAHERGVVHRDLKPANIKVADGGAVKILDFGIATVIEQSASVDRAQAVTLTHLTQDGALLGTPAYMSPEQAKTLPVDRRTDIWAFGCVVYEMLTGTNAFVGDTATDVLAAVLKNEPDWSKLPTATPSRVRALLKRCLQKDTRLRLQAIGEARIVLDGLMAGAPEETSTIVRRSLSPLAASLAAAALAAIVGIAAWELKPTPATPRPVTRFTISLPPDQAISGVALSPDGSELAYAATRSDGKSQLFVRPLDAADARAIPGTEGATGPFFSPDGESLGFFASGGLKKVVVKSGSVQTLTNAANFASGGAWSARGAIVFAPLLSALWTLPESGGTATMLTRLDGGETAHVSPEFLPGGRDVLFATVAGGRSAIVVQSTDGGSRHDVMQGEGLTSPRLASSGHLIVAQPGGLVAAPFDTVRLALGGTPVRVVGDVSAGPGVQYALSANGTLAYIRRSNPIRESRLVWVSRDGRAEAIPVPVQTYNQPRVSPDGRRVAVDVADFDATMLTLQIWLYDIDRGTFAPATFGATNRHAVFSPDGKRFAFMSTRTGAAQVFWQLADGSGAAEQLTEVSAALSDLAIPHSWSDQGGVAFATIGPTGTGDLWLQPVPEIATTTSAATGTPHSLTPPQHLFQSQAGDGAAQFSPDGRWLAYASDESGRREIFVRPFPDSGGRWQVSVDGGNEPQWNRNGRELFYKAGDKMMAVDVDTRAGFASGKPKVLFEGHYARGLGSGVRANYDVSPDGQRFVMLEPVEPTRTGSNQIDVVLNWTEELERLAPAAKK